jgi:hypothetical protein
MKKLTIGWIICAFCVGLAVGANTALRAARKAIQSNGGVLCHVSVETMRCEGVTTNVIEMLAAEGEICKVKGHNWRGGRPGEEDGRRLLDYHPGTTFRTCQLCGTCQALSTEWKDTKQ